MLGQLTVDVASERNPVGAIAPFTLFRMAHRALAPGGAFFVGKFARSGGVGHGLTTQARALWHY